MSRDAPKLRDVHFKLFFCFLGGFISLLIGFLSGNGTAMLCFVLFLCTGFVLGEIDRLGKKPPGDDPPPPASRP